MNDDRDPEPTSTQPETCVFCRRTVPTGQASKVRFDGELVWVHYQRCPDDRSHLKAVK